VLDRVDADMILNHIPVAAGFARCGADSAHHAGERIGFGEATEGIFLPGHARWRLLDTARDVEIATNVFAGGTGTLAGRRGKHVFRTFMRPARLENDVLIGANVVMRLAILITTPLNAFGFCFVRRDSHVRSPNAYEMN